GTCIRRDLKLDFLKKLRGGLDDIARVTPCVEADLLCIEAELGPFAVVDPQTGDSLLTLDRIQSGWDDSHHRWGIDSRGTRLAYIGPGMGDATCIDVRNDRELYKYEGPSFFQ